MFYQKKAGQLERADEIGQWDPAAETAGCLSLEEFEENFDALGFPGECLAVCRLPDSRFHSSLEVYDSYSLSLIHIFLPGVMPKIIRKLASEMEVPLIAGGLITDKEDVINALSAGALAVSTTLSDIWGS